MSTSISAFKSTSPGCFTQDFTPITHKEDSYYTHPTTDDSYDTPGDTPHLMNPYDGNYDDHENEEDYRREFENAYHIYPQNEGVLPSSSSISSSTTQYYSPLKETEHSPYFSGYTTRETIQGDCSQIISTSSSGGAMDMSSVSSAISSVTSHCPSIEPPHPDGSHTHNNNYMHLPKNLLPSMPSDASCQSNDYHSVSSSHTREDANANPKKPERKKKLKLRQRRRNDSASDGYPPLVQKISSPEIPGLKMLDETEDSPGNDVPSEDIGVIPRNLQQTKKNKPRLRPRISKTPSLSSMQSVGSSTSILRNGGGGGSSAGSCSSKDISPLRMKIHEIFQPKIQVKDDSPLSQHSHVPRTPSPTFSVGSNNNNISIPKVNRRKKGFPMEESPKLSTLVEGRQAKTQKPVSILTPPNNNSNNNPTNDNYPHRRAVSFPDEVLRGRNRIFHGDISMESDDPALFSLIETTHSTNGRIPISFDADTKGASSPPLRIRPVVQVYHSQHYHHGSHSQRTASNMHRRVQSDNCHLGKNQKKSSKRKHSKHRIGAQLGGGGGTSFDSSSDAGSAPPTPGYTYRQHKTNNRRAVSSDNYHGVIDSRVHVRANHMRQTRTGSPTNSISSHLMKLVEDDDYVEEELNFKRQSSSITYHQSNKSKANTKQTKSNNQSDKAKSSVNQLHPKSPKRKFKKIKNKFIPKWIRRGSSRLNLFKNKKPKQ